MGKLIAGFQDLFCTREMVEMVWGEAQRLIEKERPEIVAEAGKVEHDLARAALARQGERLSLPTLDLDEVARLLADSERWFESHLDSERKRLLHRLVKGVRVQSRDTAEVWYAFPRTPAGEGRTAHSHIWLGALVSMRADLNAAVRQAGSADKTSTKSR